MHVCYLSNALSPRSLLVSACADERLFLKAGPSSSGALVSAGLDGGGVRNLNVTLADDVTLDQLLAGVGIQAPAAKSGLGDLVMLSNVTVVYVPQTHKTGEHEYIRMSIHSLCAPCHFLSERIANATSVR